VKILPQHLPNSGSASDLAEMRGVASDCLTVCLVTEGTYPHYKGGVSTWCDMLVRGLPEVRFVLMSLVADPSASPVFELPPNVVKLITVPLWGTGEVLELQRDLNVPAVIRRKRSATQKVIDEKFVLPSGVFWANCGVNPRNPR